MLTTNIIKQRWTKNQIYLNWMRLSLTMQALITTGTKPRAWKPMTLNTYRPRQYGRHFPDAIFRWLFLNKNVWISINISLKFVPRGPINNIPTLVQVMAWRRPGDKPLSEPMMVRLSTHICVTRPQWVNITKTARMWVLSLWLCSSCKSISLCPHFQKPIDQWA